MMANIKLSSKNLNEILQLINIKIRNDGYYATITDFMLRLYTFYCVMILLHYTAFLIYHKIKSILYTQKEP